MELEPSVSKLIRKQYKGDSIKKIKVGKEDLKKSVFRLKGYFDNYFNTKAPSDTSVLEIFKE